ncbi:putative Aspartyl protease family A22B [Diplonema papillatum]|nr:putative Aspartyl protease family A22B [Diplonema papillatum]KAJ9436576.1 hypothetical protein DIPPA_70107 [Diplonema papillatum]KAJ9441359.1 putative Aspartyl protease family A22B [Diplonema papillatum]KAJ9452216.1 putative Aspartyl protease family A22B [Diplonema papillatum]
MGDIRIVLEEAFGKLSNVSVDDLTALTRMPEIYSELIIMLMAVVTIAVGSSWSVPKKMRNKAKGLPPGIDDEDEAEDMQMTAKEAAMFPILGSGLLLSLYIAYQLFPQNLFNQILSAYLVIVSVYGVSAVLYRVTGSNMLSGILAIALGVAWHITRHFAVNNVIALGICLTSLWKVKLPTFTVGWLLLWGLFVYDIWWVFGTEVMVKVAKSIDGPVLLKVPKDLMAAEWTPKEMMMLGLGDIVIPGFFVALCLRYDYHKAAQFLESGKRASNAPVSKPLFLTAIVCYTLGLVHTIFVMFVFKAAQPALLYLVPWLTFGTLLAAVIAGDLTSMFSYSEDPPPEAEPTESLPMTDQIYNLFVAELFNLEKRKGDPKKKIPEKSQEEKKNE